MIGGISMDDERKDALQEALAYLDDKNREFLRNIEDKPDQRALGYSEALGAEYVDETVVGYRYVHRDRGGPGKIGADGAFSPKKQRELLIDFLKFDRLLGKKLPTFHFDHEVDEVSPPLDRYRTGGILPALPPERKSEFSPPHELTGIEEKYGGFSEPQRYAGPTLNLIAFALLADLHGDLEEGGILRNFLASLMSDQVTAINTLIPSGHAILEVRWHAWCAPVPDLHQPAGPAIALVYTLAKCDGDNCSACANVDAIEANTRAAAHKYYETVGLNTSKHETWSFATKEGVSRSVLSYVVQSAEVSLKELEKWRDADANQKSAKSLKFTQKFLSGSEEPTTEAARVINSKLCNARAWKSNEGKAFYQKARKHLKPGR
jgi:hypothetical protein